MEEGLFTKVIFAPPSLPENPQDTLIGTYSRFLGVNWSLFTVAFLFTGLFGVAFSIWFVDRLFPSVKGKPLLSGRSFVLVAAVFSSVLLVAYLFLPWNGAANLPFKLFAYSPGPADVALVLGSVLLLSFAAWKLPRDLLCPTAPVPRFGIGVMGGLSLGFSLGFFLLAGPGENLIPWPPAVIAGIFGLGLAALIFVRTSIGRTANNRHQVAIVAGALTPYFVHDVFFELGGDVGVLAVTAAVIGLLVYLYHTGPVVRRM